MSVLEGRMPELLDAVVCAAQGAGERLREEFFRPAGPRGARGKAPIDTEIEDALRATLQALLACSFLGEETGLAPGPVGGWRWVVDPHDGTSEFLKGHRGSAVSIALLRGDGLAGPAAAAASAEIVLGVVHCPLAPDRGADSIAWAEGCGPIRRNGQAIEAGLLRGRLERGAIVWTTASGALRPHAFSRALAPAKFVAMPSIAYRLARIAAGDGVATLSLHSVNEYDIAAGTALVRAAGGVVHDAKGHDIAFSGAENARLPGCIAGAPAAVLALVGKDWESVLREPKIEPRLGLGFPRHPDEARLARAQGCLLGQVIGGRLGPQARAGQPTDDGELAIVLARAIARAKCYDASAAVAAYGEWRESRPIDVARALHGSLMRVVPIGIWAAGDPVRAARAAREDSALGQPDAVCEEACAGYAAAIAAGVSGGASADMLAAALAHCSGEVRAAIERGAADERRAPCDSDTGELLPALRNAFRQLCHASDFERALMTEARAGGKPGDSIAVAGALLGARHGRTAIPQRWILAVLACRPGAASGALQARPMTCWPDDVLELAEALITG
ncbi:MAG: hypothetical protein EPO27_00475 [Betaproteobacteria bacterium]|nr:MAG: hypothetical protein EPO27_00475 [Betaproteobacteria bacterium]